MNAMAILIMANRITLIRVFILVLRTENMWLAKVSLVWGEIDELDLRSGVLEREKPSSPMGRDSAAGSVRPIGWIYFAYIPLYYESLKTLHLPCASEVVAIIIKYCIKRYDTRGSPLAWLSPRKPPQRDPRDIIPTK